MTPHPVVLAYSGGLKSSVAIPWLIDTYRVSVVAVVLDLGQGEDVADLRQRALSAGAIRCHVIDAREELARDYLVPSVRADALLGGRYPMPTALGRSLIAKTVSTIARIEQATTVAHAGAKSDHLRLTGAVHAIDAGLRVIPCTEAWTFTPAELIAFAERHHISVGEGVERVDRNLWGKTVGRWLDAGAAETPEGLDVATRVELGPRDASTIAIEFDRGTPLSLNGVAMPPVELIESLTTLGGEHAVGRLSRVKAREARRTSVVSYEAPAAVLLHTAHAELQRRTVPERVQRFASTIAMAYAELIDRGEWFSDLRPALDAFVTHVQQGVTGVVELKLEHGTITIAGVRQPATLNL